MIVMYNVYLYQGVESMMFQVTRGMSFTTLAMGYREIIPSLQTTEDFTLEAANTILVQESSSYLIST